MTLADVFRARRRIAGHVCRTPLMYSPRLSEAAGTRVSLKLESLQVTHSFKARGAFNAVIARRERSRNGMGRLVTASAGNHGRGLAMAAQTFGTPLVVYTPAGAPRSKLDAIRQHKATLVADACDYDAAESQAKPTPQKPALILSRPTTIWTSSRARERSRSKFSKTPPMRTC